MSPPSLLLALLFCLAVLSDSPTVEAQAEGNAKWPPSVQVNPAEGYDEEPSLVQTLPAEGNAKGSSSVRVDAGGDGVGPSSVQVIPVRADHGGPSHMQDDPVEGNVKVSSTAPIDPVRRGVKVSSHVQHNRPTGGEEDGGAGGEVSLSEFMEEMRGAMSSQWELLQNLRYHTLGIKVRLAQVESHLHALTSTTRPTASGTEDEDERSPCQEPRISVLVDAVKDLTSAYASFINSSRCDNFEGDFTKLKGSEDDTKDSSLGNPLVESDFPTTTTTTTTSTTTTADATDVLTEDYSHIGEVGDTYDADSSGPYIIPDNTEVVVREGDTATIVCRTRHLTPHHRVSWFHDDKQQVLTIRSFVLQPISGMKAALDPLSGDYVLTVEAVNLDDAGRYSCRIGPLPSVSYTFHLKVLEKKSNHEDEATTNHQQDDVPKIVGSEGNITAQAGNSALLNCLIENYHQDSILWYRGRELLARGLEVLSPDHRYISSRTARFHWWLDITNLQPSDSGEYRCTLVGSPVNYTFSLTVLGETGPHITRAVQGQVATLTCPLSGIEEKQLVSWIRKKDLSILTVGQITVSSDPRFTASKGSRGGTSQNEWELRIADVKRSDAGEYECIVGYEPRLSRTVSLRVEDPRRDLAESSSSSSSSSLGGGKAFNVASGGSVTFTCSLPRSRPDAVITWVRLRDLVLLSVDASLMTTDSRFSVLQEDEEDGEARSLLLVAAKREDSGVYQCSMNDDVSSHQNFTLHVHDPVIDDPAPEEVMAVVGREVILTCEAVSGQQQQQQHSRVTWFKQGQWVSNSGHFEISDKGELIIRAVRESDGGEYTCRITNHQTGTLVETRTSLLVVQPTWIARAPRDRQRQEGQNVVFRCKPEANSNLEVTVDWLKEGKLIDFTDSSRIGLRPNNALVINSAREEDSGVYTCLASTRLDSVTANATLTVQARRKDERGGDTAEEKVEPPTPLATPLDYCPPPYERLQSHLCILQVTDRKLSWSDAAKYCGEEGGRLGWMDGNENVFQTYLHERYGLGGNLWTHWPFWVGGKESEEGDRREWRWEDGASVNPEVWAEGHPRSYGTLMAPRGSCMVLDGFQDYQATSLPCHYRRFFLCRL